MNRREAVRDHAEDLIAWAEAHRPDLLPADSFTDDPDGWGVALADIETAHRAAQATTTTSEAPATGPEPF